MFLSKKAKYISCLALALLAALSFSCSQAFASDPAKLLGYVKPCISNVPDDINSGFKVELTGCSSITTNSSGSFELTLSTGSQSRILKISKEGYVSRTIQLSTIAEDVILKLNDLDMFAGDINGDSSINMSDIIKLALSFNALKGSPGYNGVCDFNLDGNINMSDIIIMAVNFNKTPADYPELIIDEIPLNGPNLLSNGDFSTSSTSWSNWIEAGATASISAASGEYTLDISNTGPNPHSIHFYQGPVKLTKGKVYELSFDARSTIDREIRPTVENSTTYAAYLFTTASLTNKMTRHTFKFTASADDANARILFSVGSIFENINQHHTIYMDNISFKDLSGVNLTPTPLPTPYPSSGQWKLVWKDEFDSANGSKPDSTKWTYDIGGSGWGNNELQYYTSNVKNAYIDNGNLIIKAITESYNGKNYTSARLKTLGKFEAQYGKFEARMKLPYGQGIWPAFWMLGNDIDSTSWPVCGEIDIMEFIGKEPPNVYGTIHGPGYCGGEGKSAKITVPKLSDEYHTFTIEWEPDVIRWYVDGTLYHTETTSRVSPNKWAYDHPFFMILNLAIGGNWPGSPDATTVFPQTLTVDYVRVYQRQ
ncbi:family 16 glycosylhydrolase [Pseudobacteroides cellulosolvens]|uniref:Glucan endo-1,3-beta-D-glucosidase n=1 Tax=Pseudobacteroides cellulosolvens ATCC 35603 = DSM 2933 TaxID=398512 RepID=A0A0L6JUY4_9FIRM|nr:family 16 glycosylhydrolase [Pseudobacteroides cellulosolvens]KNY29671.1 Glucan endo-1,3-beta-D-glucosidase [Pseudobacteroides cellulosolvens ATCC 35603 = DSM 2933]